MIEVICRSGADFVIRVTAHERNHGDQPAILFVSLANTEGAMLSKRMNVQSVRECTRTEVRFAPGPD